MLLRPTDDPKKIYKEYNHLYMMASATVPIIADKITRYMKKHEITCESNIPDPAIRKLCVWVEMLRVKIGEEEGELLD